MFDLPLEFREPNYYNQHDETDVDESQIKHLESIKKFKDRLIYIHNNVKNLSLYHAWSTIFVRWGKPEKYLKIYDGSKEARRSFKFSETQERIFLTLRAREVRLLAEQTNKQLDYKKRLELLFNIKGYQPEGVLTIYKNIKYGTVSNPELALNNLNTLIDLTPKNKEQRVIYNGFVKKLFNDKYYTSNGFSHEYIWFDFVKQKERFDKQLMLAQPPGKLVKTAKEIIENYFGYYPDESNPIKSTELKETLEGMGILANLFSRLAFGEQIDLDKYMITQRTMLDYTHHSEIVKFYKYVSNWKETSTVGYQPSITPLINDVSKKPALIMQNKADTKNYSLKQIAIAYFILKITITKENAVELLAKHSQFKSANKLLQKRINKSIELTKITGDKTADTKHMHDLEAAKRLMSGIKNKKGVDEISRIITAFQTSYNVSY